MKSVVFAVGVLAAIATAQDLSDCAKKCLDDMQGVKAQGLGCRQGDFGCLCTKTDYLYGVRDCNNEACSGQNQNQVFSAASKTCGDHGVQVNTAAAANGGSASTGSGSGSGSGSQTVQTIFSTFSSGGSVQSTPISSTTITGGDQASSTGGAGAQASSQASSQASQASSQASSAASSATAGASTTVSSASSQGAAAVQTPAPGTGVGMLAAAGIAALLI